MKQQLFSIFICSLFILLSFSCTKFEFNNPADPDVKLKPPTNLTATFLADTAVRLRWKDDDISPTYPNSKLSFEIYKSTDGTNFSLVKTVGENTTTATLSGMYLITTAYSFRVRAKIGDKVSGYSSKISITPTFSAPTNLTITTFTGTQIGLQWTDNSNIETGFEIERSTDTVNFSLLQTVSANITIATITETHDSTSTYYYRIRAKSAANVTAYSNTTFATLKFAEMIFVQGGTFSMGGNTNGDEQPIHSVTLSNFSISKYEITYKQWSEVKDWGINNGYTDLPSGRKGYTGDSTHPVTEVNWYDIMKWCNALSEKNGRTPVYYTNSSFTTVYKTGNVDLQNTYVNLAANGYRLPTEAEWEYAARGGIHSGDNYTYSGSNDVNAVAWYSSNSSNNTHVGGTKAANQLGIYDMSGNVWEWCWDWYGSTYYSSSPSGTPQGPTSGTYRVLRGGSFVNVDNYSRVAVRNYNYPDVRINSFGFRFSRTN